jgi:hypothetical protein
MGYFSNGTEGEIYEARYCRRCIHGQDEKKGCAVWDAHLAKNYDEANNDNSILHMLIPLKEGGVYNDECRMFIERRTRKTRRAAKGER